MNYYNEIDLFAAQWLKELIRAGLILAGDVDERSIEDVLPTDLKPYRQCHFFAGWSSGPLLSSSQGGQKTSLSGQGVFHATLSARQAREQGLMTSGTYGQRSFGFSSSVALQSSLASKLVQSLPLSGGISWHLTWKARTTPRLRQICHLCVFARLRALTHFR